MSNRWTRNFTVTQDDLDFIMNTLLEKETPMTIRELATILIQNQLEIDQAAVEDRFKNTRVFRPTDDFAIGERIAFPSFELATGVVTKKRAGENEAHGEFDVIEVAFDHKKTTTSTKEFAINLKTPHKLSDIAVDNPLTLTQALNPKEIIESSDGQILRVLANALRDQSALARVAGYWFPRELVIECDIGTLHLAEAVLDMANGGPLSTESILEQIGGIGNAPIQLQVFSLNVAMSTDSRFDEVGPAGQVLWFLNRMEPEPVRTVPSLLKYTPIEYNDDLLSDEMFDLETELDDEFTPIEFEGNLKKASTIIIYPHRRAGTLPLSAKNRTIFPTARTPRIHVDLIDGQDGQIYKGWVVHENKYVYGLTEFYTKHRLPVGARINIERGENPGQIIINYDAHKPRTEWIRILNPVNNQITFENRKRQIGAEYDDLVVIGVDDLEAVDKLAKSYQNKPLATIMRELIAELSKLSPQGTVHAVTLYSAVNVVRRCAPGPVFATLTANPNFEDVGNHYWKLNHTAE